MWHYAYKRLLLLPLTLFCIVLLNFLIINLAPGDPSSYASISSDGNFSRREDRSISFSQDERYLHFREFYGLTLPIFLNTWPWLSKKYVENSLKGITYEEKRLPTKEYSAMKSTFGDQSRFVMPHLMEVMQNSQMDPKIQQTAFYFFLRGASRPAITGPQLTEKEKKWNKKITQDDLYLRSLVWSSSTSPQTIETNINALKKWMEENAKFYLFYPSFREKIKMLFLETRFQKYMDRVLHLDFGTLRNDSNRTVISEVTKRLKYSLTLSIIPMGITFVFCQFFGFLMAIYHKKWIDDSLNMLFLILYAIPVFVMAPFLIEKIALSHCFPWTHSPIPINGFTSPSSIYENKTSLEKIFDILQHIALPVVAILYNTLASESRLSRSAILEVMRQDYVRTAKAKGVPPLEILVKHIGRNAAITIVTSIAGSLGIILGGSLIVETLFDINGFGKFFYEAILNRDYNVIMFSALVGSFLTLLGYLVADLAYMWLDPRVRLE